MADPLSVVTSIISIYQALQAQVEAVSANKERFKLLVKRCETLMGPINGFQNDPSSIDGKTGVLMQFHDCFHDIRMFMELPRFQNIPKTISIARFREFYYAMEDETKFRNLNDRLTTVLNDLNVIIGVNVSITMNKQLTDEAKRADDRARKAELKKVLELLGKPISGSLSLSTGSGGAAIKEILEKSADAAATIEQITSALFDQASSSIKKVEDSQRTALDIIQLTPINQKLLHWDAKRSRKLGSGAFGQVYVGRYNNVEVAVKSFPGIMDRVDEKALKSVKREALIMQCLNHPNVIGFVAASLQQGLLVTELACCSLDDVLYGRNPVLAPPASAQLVPKILTLEWKLNIAADIAKGLRYIHAFNVVHRDIKPANVLITVSADKRCVAKLCDFGLSRAVDIVASTVGAKSTRQQAVGTVHYMAPEVFENSAPGDAQADMYAYGILVGEVFAGERPWTGLESLKISRKVVDSKERPSLAAWQAKLQDDCEKELFALVGDSTTGCLAQEPADRPTAAAVCDGLNTKDASDSSDIDDLDTIVFDWVDTDSLSTPSGKSFTTGPLSTGIIVEKSDEQLIAEHVKWFKTATPDIAVEKLEDYAKVLYANRMTTLTRLKHLHDNDKTLLSGLGFSVLDVEDIDVALNNRGPSVAGEKPSYGQGPKALKAWIKKCTPDIPHYKISDYVQALVDADIHNVSRLKRVVNRDKAWLDTFHFEMQDTEDIVAACGPVATTPLTKRVQGFEALNQWMIRLCPDIAVDLTAGYVKTLITNGIVTVARLRRVVMSNDTFLEGIGVDEMDAKDITAALQTVSDCGNDHGYQKANSASSKAVQGPEVFYNFIKNHTEGIVSSKIEICAKAICDHNVVTERRLYHLVKQDSRFLYHVLDDDLDARDITEAVKGIESIWEARKMEEERVVQEKLLSEERQRKATLEETMARDTNSAETAAEEQESINAAPQQGPLGADQSQPTVDYKPFDATHYTQVRDALITSRRPHEKLTKLVKNYHTQYGPSLFEYQDDYQWTLGDWAQWSFREGEYTREEGYKGLRTGENAFTVNSKGESNRAVLNLAGLIHPQANRSKPPLRRCMCPYCCWWCVYHPFALCSLFCSKSCACVCVKGCVYDSGKPCPCCCEAVSFSLKVVCIPFCEDDTDCCTCLVVLCSCPCWFPIMCPLSAVGYVFETTDVPYKDDVLQCCKGVLGTACCGPFVYGYDEVNRGCPCIIRNCAYLPPV